MSDLLKPLEKANRLLFSVKLKPLLGDSFQPTGFPSLGAAEYRSSKGRGLLVESVQSMANRLELIGWDSAENAPESLFASLSHVTVKRNGSFLTDSILEPHRLNSPYILCSDDRTFLDSFLHDLTTELGSDVVQNNSGLISRQRLAKIIFKYDVGSLIHGLFFANNKVQLDAKKKSVGSIAGGRLRFARCLSAFVQADDVETVASGGSKLDHVHPEKVKGNLSELVGNVIYPRDHYTSDSIYCHANIDLAQIRGYGLGLEATNLLITLSMYRLRAFLDGDMRLRSQCDLELDDSSSIIAKRPSDFQMPSLEELTKEVTSAIEECSELMRQTEMTFNLELEKAKKSKQNSADDENLDTLAD